MKVGQGSEAKEAVVEGMVAVGKEDPGRAAAGEATGEGEARAAGKEGKAKVGRAMGAQATEVQETGAAAGGRAGVGEATVVTG